MSYADMFAAAKKEFGLGGGFFAIKDGEAKRVRLFGKAIPHQSINKFATDEDGPKLRTQFLTYLIDREDGKIKPYFMPVSVMEQIVNWQMNPEYAFVDEIPYDLVISRKKETGQVKYIVQAARENVPLTEAEKQEIAGVKPLSQVLDAIKKKNADVPDAVNTTDDLKNALGITPEMTRPAPSTEEISLDDIPE